MNYELKSLQQEIRQELHRDRISQVYLGELSDAETQKRARTRIDWIVENTKPGKIFDIGCSEGIMAIQLARKNYQIDAIDIHPEVLSYAEILAEKMIPDFFNNINFKLQNIFDIPDIKPIYDTVVIGEVIEHVFEPENMLKRAVLALKKNGRIIVTTPFGYSPAPDHHQTFFLSSFLKIVPTVLRCDHISIAEGYIRFIGTKIMDTDDPQKIPEKLKATSSIAVRKLLATTERGALDSQKHLRSVFENRSALLEQARDNSIKLKRERDDAIAETRNAMDLLEKSDKERDLITQQQAKLRKELDRHHKLLEQEHAVISQFKQERDAEQREFTSLKNILEDRSALLEQARNRTVHLTKQRDEARHKTLASNKENDVQRAKIELFETRIEQLQTEQKDANSEVSRINDTLITLARERDQANDLLAAKDASFADRSALLEQARNRTVYLTKQRDKARHKMVSSKKQGKELKSKVKHLQTKQNKTGSKVQRIKKSLASVTGERDRTTELLDAERIAHKQQRSELEHARSITGQLEEERDQARHEMVSSKKQGKQLQAKVNHLQAEQNKADNKVLRIEGSLALAVKQREELNELLMADKRSLKQLRANIDLSRARVKQLQAERDEAGDKILKIKGTLSQMSGERDRYKKSYKNETAELKKRNALLEGVRESAANLKTARDQGSRRIQELRTVIEEQEAKFNTLYELSRQQYASNNVLAKKQESAKKPPATTINVDQNPQPAALSKNIKKSKLASTADFLAGNSYIRSFVRRTVPPALKRRITSKINGTPMASPAMVEKPVAKPLFIAKPSYAGLLPDTVEYASILLCNSYPGGVREYGGEFIRSRAESYASKDHSTLIVEISALNKKPEFGRAGGLDCLRIPIADLEYFLNKLKDRTSNVLTHSPTPETLKTISGVIEPSRCFHWFHGFEVRDYRRLFFNYSTAELERLRGKLDAINQERIVAAKSCFADRASTKIFVSDYIKTVAENDIGQVIENGLVIPNFIDGGHYRFQQKSPQDARRILLIRTFQNRNYANDIAINAIKRLSERPGFDDLHFTICGFGSQFQPLTKQLESLPNVDIRNGHLNAEQMQQLHSEHGIFLVPSRFDTQGVTMGEAMASGLVCITNNTTAIPEYADQNCACLVRPDDPKAYAEAIWDLCQNPEKLPEMSRAAAERARHQCGFERTIKRELDLLSN